MPYEIRVFCAADETPTLGEVIEFVKACGLDLKYRDHWDLTSTEWTSFDFEYNSEGNGVEVYCTRWNETADPHCHVAPEFQNPVAREVDDFLEALDDLERTDQVQEVIYHLRKTSFIVICNVPFRASGNEDEFGFQLFEPFLDFFRDYCDGILHIEGVGFYLDDESLVEVR